MITSALIISELYARQVAHGVKRWELRSSHCHKREQIGIIAQGTGTIIGCATVVASHGPMTRQELVDAKHLHVAPLELLADHPEWVYGWEFATPVSLTLPVAYDHPNGAQSWVKIDHATALRIAYQTDSQVRRCFGRSGK